MRNFPNKPSSNLDEITNSSISEKEFYSVGIDCNISKDAIIGKYTNIGKGVIVGKNCRLGQNVNIGDGVIFGENCEIQNNVCFPEGVICGNNVFIGHSTIFSNHHFPHRLNNIKTKREQMITQVNNGVKIGVNVTVICGIEIGKFAFIVSSSFITNDIKPYALIMGNPAKQRGWISEHGCKLNFLNKNKIATCPESGIIYKLDGLSVRKLE